MELPAKFGQFMMIAGKKNLSVRFGTKVNKCKNLL
jgi:hypothetical protein